ncbi:NUDIX hydrolase [Methanocella sp. CWC-04]|uniref:NUDIX hydrolase n=1 Tax=Methanooceanicella nereidis TaxID=2052831 RepID=A0AAP2RF98_9EURY|nr:NUDIX domain-containing protein [Methanocella sp. CWC-04]MCD1295045.1 NUDIX hydrolase [Methanocella sp. CWC-04]
MDEFFDIVNDNDEVIGRATRKEVHSKGHVHRSVLFYIFDKENRVFVNQRTMNKEFYPGYWSIVFGGHVHAGETYEDAVIREVEEEAGIVERPIFITSFKKRFDENDKENVNVYAFMTCRELIIDPGEIRQGIFMTMKELGEKLGKEKFLPETPGLYDILKKYMIK